MQISQDTDYEFVAGSGGGRGRRGGGDIAGGETAGEEGTLEGFGGVELGGAR